MAASHYIIYIYKAYLFDDFLAFSVDVFEHFELTTQLGTKNEQRNRRAEQQQHDDNKIGDLNACLGLGWSFRNGRQDVDNEFKNAKANRDVFKRAL